MKSEKGVTLISVIVYLLAMTMALAIVGLITSFFFENIFGIRETAELTNQYNKFNMFFIEDMKNSYAVTVDKDNNKVQFTPKVGSEEVIIYSLSEESIFRNNVKIADNIFDFSVFYEGEDTLHTFKVSDNIKNGITVQIMLTDTTSFSMTYYLGRGY